MFMEYLNCVFYAHNYAHAGCADHESVSLGLAVNETCAQMKSFDAAGTASEMHTAPAIRAQCLMHPLLVQCPNAFTL